MGVKPAVGVIAVGGGTRDTCCTYACGVTRCGINHRRINKQCQQSMSSACYTAVVTSLLSAVGYTEYG